MKYREVNFRIIINVSHNWSNRFLLEKVRLINKLIFIGKYTRSWLEHYREDKILTWWYPVICSMYWSDHHHSNIAWLPQSLRPDWLAEASDWWQPQCADTDREYWSCGAWLEISILISSSAQILICHTAEVMQPVRTVSNFTGTSTKLVYFIHLLHVLY